MIRGKFGTQLILAITLGVGGAWAHGDGDSDGDMAAPPIDTLPVEAAHGDAGGMSEEVSGHHAMTHPFLTHMGIPDGPGEVSVRTNWIERAQRRYGGSDFALHVEAGITDRFGLHLRNDAVRGAGMDTSMAADDHGTELMLMYAFLQNKAVTRGLSVLAEIAAPTVQGDASPVKYGVGLGGRWIQGNRVQGDAIIHVAPTKDEVMVEYETSVVVRVAGKVFGVVETSGESKSESTSNYILLASKVGLGRTGNAVGVGFQFATTSAREYARQVLFQFDMGF